MVTRKAITATIMTTSRNATTKLPATTYAISESLLTVGTTGDELSLETSVGTIGDNLSLDISVGSTEGVGDVAVWGMF